MGDKLQFTFGSLFAGIGGIDLGLERAGMTCKWQVEYNTFAQKVLAKHWPNVRRYGDVKEITELEYVDLIAGGFPCQPVSVAGSRKGANDERWLWPEFRRIINMVRPEFIIVENVPGLLSIDNGRLFGGILGDMAQSGYDAEWGCISAASMGAPHKRNRVFIVAHPKGMDGLWSTKKKDNRVFQGCPESRGYFTQEWIHIAAQFCGVDDGIPNRVDRLRCLGNAVVPQVAEYIGKQLLNFIERNK